MSLRSSSWIAPLLSWTRSRPTLPACLAALALASSGSATFALGAQTPPAPAPTPTPAPAPTATPPAAAPAAPAVDPEVEIAAARTALIARLVGLAQWCHKVELFEERDKVWTQVLALDAKNLDAHKGLQHARSTDGSWHETNRHILKNRSTKALPELPQKRADAMKPFSELCVSRAKETQDPARRNVYIGAILAIDPDDPTVHAWQGDTRDGDKWVLPETLAARDRRAFIKGLVKSALEEAPATKPEALAEKDPKPAGYDWKSGLTTGLVRVFSTGAEEDARQLARTCSAARTVARTLFGDAFELPPGLTFYVLEPGQKDAMLATFVGADDEDKARMAKLEGTGLPRRQDVALWSGNKPRTLDMAVRHTFSYLFNRGIGLQPTCGWLWEGTGLYLTREVTGTRLTWFVSADTSPTAAASAALQARLLSQDANWMKEALTLLTGDNPPQVGEVMKRDLAHLTVRDAVVAYVLAAYLIESRADKAAEFAKRSAAGEDPEAITRATLGMSTEDLQKRIVRWLGVRK